MVEIKHYDGLNYTPAAILAVKAQLDLLESGLSDPLISLNWDNKAVVASVDGNGVGVITWHYIEWIKTVEIHIGWVDPSYRCRGIYKQMWESLVVESKKLNAARIIGTTHMDNVSMRKVAKELGRQEFSVNLVYRL